MNLFAKLTLVLCYPITVFSTPLPSNSTDDWGQTGHRVVGAVATQHLSKKAQKKIVELLDGHSLAWVSTYADEIKSDERFKSYDPWHYINMPLSADYDPAKASVQGDLVQGINRCVAQIKDTKLPKSDRQFALKMLVHLVGDLHQPLHIGRAEDKGGNDIKLKWFGRNSNLHRVWDSELIDYFDLSYSEWTQDLPRITKAQVRSLQSTSVLDWVEESQDIAAKLYEKTPAEANLYYEYTYEYKEVVTQRLLWAGVRLAGILEDLF
ncbi:MAG: hypothetical protein RL501_600 [Bacteroidota bacterium]|jgi:hypothetical protein